MAAVVLAPAIARADDIATDEDVCRGKADGTPCTHDHGTGTCQATTCPSIDYSTKPPGSKDRPCSKCLPAKAEPPAAKGTSDPTPATTPTSTATSTAGSAAAPSAGCAIDPGAGTLGSLLLGLGLVAMGRRGAAR